MLPKVFRIREIKSNKIIGRNWLEVNATVAETEGLFNTEYHYYEHDLSGGYRIACDQYHLPETVREHIDFAVGLSVIIELGNLKTDL